MGLIEPAEDGELSAVLPLPDLLGLLSHFLELEGVPLGDLEVVVKCQGILKGIAGQHCNIIIPSCHYLNLMPLKFDWLRFRSKNKGGRKGKTKGVRENVESKSEIVKDGKEGGLDDKCEVI